MASIDLEKMLTKVKSTQWTLSDIDWDAPGRELITQEQIRPKSGSNDGFYIAKLKKRKNNEKN